MSSQSFPEKELDERLQALKQAMEGMAAPDRVEAAVVAAFRRREMRPVARAWPRWALAAAAAVIVVAGVALLLNREPVRQAPAPALPPVAVGRREVPEVAASAAPAPTLRRARPRQAVAFIPLVPDLSWGPGESAQVMRVSMPRSALESFGLPVDETRAFETVRADIIVGQDMVARAIRVVR